MRSTNSTVDLRCRHDLRVDGGDHDPGRRGHRALPVGARTVEADHARSGTAEGPGGDPPVGRFHGFDSGLRVGSKVSDFALASRQRGPTDRRFSNLLTAPSSVFVFIDAVCPPCRALTERIATDGFGFAAVPVYVITDQPLEQAVAANTTVLFQHGGAASAAFDQLAYPQAFVVDDTGVVRHRAFPNSAKDLRQLLGSANGQASPGPEKRHQGR